MAERARKPQEGVLRTAWLGRWHCFLIVVLLLLAGSARRVLADTDGQSLQRYRTEFETLSASLQLDEDQRAAALSLYGQLEERSGRATDRLIAYIGAVQRHHELEPRERNRLEREASWKLKVHNERVQEELYADLRTLITPDQAERWPLFEREMRRFRSLGAGSLVTGGGFDVSRQVGLALGSAALSVELASLLEEYREAIDPAVRILEAKERALSKLTWGVEWEESKAIWTSSSEAAELCSVARAARDTNLRFARQVVPLLDAEQAQRFETALHQEARWRIERSDRRELSPSQLIDRVLSLGGLSREQTGFVSELRARYEPSLRELARQGFEACVAIDSGRSDEEVLRQQYIEEKEPAIREVRDASAKLALSIAREIEPILTEDQLAQAGPPFRAPPLPDPNFDDEDLAEGSGEKGQGSARIARSDAAMQSDAKRSAALLAESIDLRPEQVDAASELYLTFGRRMEAAGLKLRRFYDAFDVQERAGHVDSASKTQREAGRKYREFKDRLSRELNDDLQSILTEKQMEAWPEFERECRRREAMHLGYFLVYKSSFDVAATVNGVMDGRAPSAELAAIVEEYKLAIDRPLRAMKESDRAIEARIDQVEGTLTTQFYKRIPERKLLVQAARQARDINLRFAKAVLPLLDEDSRASFEETLHYAPSWSLEDGRQVRPTPSGTLYRALELQGLTISQRAELQQIQAEVQKADREYQRKLFEAYIHVQSALTDEELMEEPKPETFPEIEAACAAGDALVCQIAERMRPILTEEQFASLGLVVRTATLPVLEFED